MKSTLISVTFAALLACLLPEIGSAQVTTTFAKDAPNANIALSVVSNLGPTFSTQWRNDTNSNQRDIGQTFTPSKNFVLNAITMQLAVVGSGAPGAEFTLTLSEFADSQTEIPSSKIATWSGTMGITGLEANSYLTFKIPSTALTEGKTYGFTLSFRSPRPGGAINFYSGANYKEGTGFTYEVANDSYQKINFTFYLTEAPSK